MDPQKVVEIIWKDEIKKAKNPNEVRQAKLKELLETYVKFPVHGAEYLMVNEIIKPQDTRPALIRRLEYLANKKEAWPVPYKKHSLIPR